VRRRAGWRWYLLLSVGSRRAQRPALGSRGGGKVVALCCCFALLVAGCGAPPPPVAAAAAPAQQAFYYWRPRFALSAAERSALAEQGIDRLYVRVFDIDAAGERVAPLVLADAQALPAGLEIVPVVFVRQAALRGEIARLADRVWAGVREGMQRLGAQPRELQIDCDWTEGTRAAFFGLLQELRAAAPGVMLSATLRLHQVKYRERSGVPPVERAMLMFYNMGEFSADPAARAIFDAERAARYLARVRDYPLPLDVALPLWSWVVQLRRGQVVDLLQSADPDELPQLDFLSRTGPGRYTATRNAFWHGVLLRRGDELKAEVTGPAESLAAAELLAPQLAPGSRTVTLFDLSERNLRRHDSAALARLFRALR
jgi:hypothetical protein